MSNTKKDPKVSVINEVIQLSKIRDEYWSFHPSNPQFVDVTIELPKIDKMIDHLQEKISELDK